MTNTPSWLSVTDEERKALDRMNIYLKLLDRETRVCHRPLKVEPTWSFNARRFLPKMDHLDYWKNSRPWQYRTRRRTLRVFGSLESLEEFVNSLT